MDIIDVVSDVICDILYILSTVLVGHAKRTRNHRLRKNQPLIGTW